MSNFGVVELASKRTTSAPGWAYVPDLSPTPIPGAKSATKWKRAARNVQGLSAHDQSARHEAKILKGLQALDREGNRDATIAVPQAGRSASAKHTPAVRKILQSQKTFANYLNDFEAQLSHDAGHSHVAPLPVAPSKRSKRASLVATATTAAAVVAASASSSAHRDREDLDVSKVVDILKRDTGAAEAEAEMVEGDGKHPRDGDPLLESWVPEVPRDVELRRLLAVPPRNYLELRGVVEGTGTGTGKMRVFCEICGYWGKVRCTKCGVRVCALDCLNVHREECITRYGL